MFKKHQIVAIQAEEHAPNMLNRWELNLYSDMKGIPKWGITEHNSMLAHNPKNKNSHIPYHLYILSDEDIKEDDWIVYSNQVLKYSHPTLVVSATAWRTKIIATTDKSLGLPLIPDSFIKKYANKDGIDEIMVKYETIQTTKDKDYAYYGNNQSNLNYITRLKIASNNTVTIKSTKQIPEEYKVLAQKAYNKALESVGYSPIEFGDWFDKWIEENL